MQRKNYFEILDLNFDPPESNKRKIEQAIEAWKKQTEDLRANAVQEIQRNELTEALDHYEDMKEVLLDPKTRNQEAKAYKEEKIRQLETLIEIMMQGQEGTGEVTNGQIRNVANKLRLQPGTVSKVYVDSGFVVQKSNTGAALNEVFLKNNIFDTISAHLTILQNIKELKYPWFSKTKDLYDLACYYCGGGDEDCADYHQKKTSELLTVMQKGGAQYASDMSDSGHALADLFSDGKTQVYNSEENRKKYDQSIEKEQLASFFILLKKAPEEFKRDRQFADTCIRTIQKHFPDYNIALALYNREAGLVTDPYEPIEALIHLTCATCRAPAEFRTREEAVKAKCRACGADLYVVCPECGRKIPANANRCACGFMISEMRFFEEYKKAALEALKDVDLTEARHQLSKAENANPRHSDLPGIRKQIQDAEVRYKQPLDKLQKYIEAGEYCRAEKFLLQTAAAMPKLRLETQRKTIKEKLDIARRMMPASKDMSFEAGNRCVTILETVKDFQPAIDLLRTIRPRKPRNFNVAAGSENALKHMLSWNTAGDRGITYRVVRKTNGIPSSHIDGEILGDNLNVLEFEDISVRPGIGYGYALFAERQGVYSDAVIFEMVNYSELDSRRLQCSEEDGAIRFQWVLPENVIGVRVLKCIEKIPGETPGMSTVVVADRAVGGFSDTDVENLRSYGYRLQCVYSFQNAFKYSKGITKIASPQPKLTSLEKLAFKMNKNLVMITWAAMPGVSSAVEVRETASSSAKDIIGQVLPMSQINSLLGVGKSYVHVLGSDGKCQFQIPGNYSCTLAVVTLAGSKGMVSTVRQVSSVEKCEINKRETRVEGNLLKIKIDKIPKYLNKIHYIMSLKTDPKAIPWAVEKDARSRQMLLISAEEYEKSGLILIRPVPQEDLYVTVIGEYKMPDGQTVFAEPSKHRVANTPKKKITYSMSWKPAGMISRIAAKGPKYVAKDAKLTVECMAADVPELKLLCRTDGHIPMKMEDPQAVVLCTIPETDKGYPSKIMQIALPDSTWNMVRPGSHLRLMLQEEDLMEFELVPKDINMLMVPAN